MSEKVFSKYCFKCKQELDGIVIALCEESECRSRFWKPSFPAHLKCLGKNLIIYDTPELQVSGDMRHWTNQYTKSKGKLYWAHGTTMWSEQYDRDRSRSRYCTVCKKDCGLGALDQVYFYIADHKHLLEMNCDSCFNKKHTYWYTTSASTTSGGTLNREGTSVALFSSFQVYQGLYGDW